MAGRKALAWGVRVDVDVELYPDPVRLEATRLAVRFADRRALSLRPTAFRAIRRGRSRYVCLMVDAEVVREAEPV